LREFRALSSAERDAIRPWVQEMCRGMADFARAHPAAQPGSVDALDTEADLDRYCYYVAGTVGHLLTALFRLHHRISDDKARILEQHATSFGLGLQLVNIIKDVADDRQRGWMFVPRQWCAECGTSPEGFLDPAHAAAARTVMERMIAKAERHLADALTYCCALPRGAYGSRLFCLTPLYFAIRTLAVAAADSRLLDPAHKVKITRPEVYRIIAMSRVIAPSNGLVKAYSRHLRVRHPNIPIRNQ
jgi:farnesyl-diphosphate farnesyltransferase